MVAIAICRLSYLCVPGITPSDPSAVNRQNIKWFVHASTFDQHLDGRGDFFEIDG